MVGNRLDRDAYETILVLAAGGPRSARYVLQQQATFKLGVPFQVKPANVCDDDRHKPAWVPAPRYYRRLHQTKSQLLEQHFADGTSITSVPYHVQQQPLRADLNHIIH
jgi:hypothetical protein